MWLTWQPGLSHSGASTCHRADIDDDADLVPFADMEEGGDDDDDDDDDEGEACKSHCGWKKDYNELVDDFYDSEDDELLVDDIEFDSDDEDKDIPADGTEVGVIPEEEDCRKKRCSFEASRRLPPCPVPTLSQIERQCLHPSGIDSAQSSHC